MLSDEKAHDALDSNSDLVLRSMDTPALIKARPRMQGDVYVYVQ